MRSLLTQSDYTLEHIIIVFLVGVAWGVISTLILWRRGLTIEKNVSLLLIFIWVVMEICSFLLPQLEVPMLFRFLGFGAAGNFIGLNFMMVKDQIVGLKNLIK